MLKIAKNSETKREICSPGHTCLRVGEVEIIFFSEWGVCVSLQFSILKKVLGEFYSAIE